MNLEGTILGEYAAEEQLISQYVVINRVLLSDGVGGQKFSIIEGLSFEGILILNTSIQGQIAQKQGVTGLYVFAYPNNLNLPPRTILRRVKDGKIFRTMNLSSVTTPDISSLDMRVTRLEDYILPENDAE